MEKIESISLVMCYYQRDAIAIRFCIALPEKSHVKLFSENSLGVEPQLIPPM